MTSDLYLPYSNFMFFEELRCKFSLDRKHSFKSLQLRSYVNVSQNNYLYQPFRSNFILFFEELSSKFSLDRKHFFKYLQLWSFVKINQNNALHKPFVSALDEMVKQDCFWRGISDLLIFYSSKNSINCLERGLSARCAQKLIGEESALKLKLNLSIPTFIANPIAN